VSGRHQGVAKIRRDGSLVWLLAPHEGWMEPQSQQLLTAVDASLTPYEEPVQLGNEATDDTLSPEFAWAFGQHSPALLPNGDLLLFDNGSSRHWGPTCGSISRAVIYRIDEAALTVRQMGQFALSKAESSCFVSNTHWLPGTGNLFIQPGGQYFDSGENTAVIKEVGAQIGDDGTIAFGAVVFAATLDMSVIPAGYFAYSFRGHRWVF
jgi:arylsulfate sulfotransferase